MAEIQSQGEGGLCQDLIVRRDAPVPPGKVKIVTVEEEVDPKDGSKKSQVTAFLVDHEVAQVSRVIQEMSEQLGGEHVTEIPLKTVSARVLDVILRFSKLWLDKKGPVGKNGRGGGGGGEPDNTQMMDDDESSLSQDQSTEGGEEEYPKIKPITLEDWETEFCKPFDEIFLFDLVTATFNLRTERFYDVLTQLVANIMSRYSAEEINSWYTVKPGQDITPKEEEKLRLLLAGYDVNMDEDLDSEDDDQSSSREEDDRDDDDDDDDEIYDDTDSDCEENERSGEGSNLNGVQLKNEPIAEPTTVADQGDKKRQKTHSTNVATTTSTTTTTTTTTNPTTTTTTTTTTTPTLPSRQGSDERMTSDNSIKTEHGQAEESSSCPAPKQSQKKKGRKSKQQKK